MILLLGDIHGRFEDFKFQIKLKKISNCIIIQVGDFGMTFASIEISENALLELNSFLKNLNITLYAIRGNHDDPFFFKGNHNYSNLKLLSDYTQLKIENNNFLFVGGAVSIDRVVSLKKMKDLSNVGIDYKLYWPEEKFILDEEKLKNIKNVDIVITHTAPEWCFPDNSGGFGDFVQNYINNDPNLAIELKEERKMLSDFFNILKRNGNNIKKHYYGHFHRSEISLNGQTTHILLGVNEIKLMEDYNENLFNEIFN